MSHLIRWARAGQRVLMGAASLSAAALPSLVAPAQAQVSYVPPIAVTASTTLFSNGSTAISPGRVGIDKAGPVF